MRGLLKGGEKNNLPAEPEDSNTNRRQRAQQVQKSMKRVQRPWGCLSSGEKADGAGTWKEVELGPNGRKNELRFKKKKKSQLQGEKHSHWFPLWYFRIIPVFSFSSSFFLGVLVMEPRPGHSRLYH